MILESETDYDLLVNKQIKEVIRSTCRLAGGKVETCVVLFFTDGTRVDVWDGKPNGLNFELILNT